MNLFYKHTLPLLFTSIFGLSTIALPTTSAYAASEIKSSMKQMKQAYRAAMGSTDINTFASNIAILQDKTAIAGRLNYHSNNASESNTYKAGIKALQEQYTALNTAIKAGDLAGGKAILLKIRDIEKKYHRQLDV